MLTQSKNTLSKKTKEQLGKSKTRKGRLRQKRASRWIENLKRRSRQKLETINRKYPDRLKNLKRQSRQKQGYKNDKVTAVSLYFVHMKNFPSTDLQSNLLKQQAQWEFKVVRDSSGYCFQCSLFPINYHFQLL